MGWTFLFILCVLSISSILEQHCPRNNQLQLQDIVWSVRWISVGPKISVLTQGGNFLFHYTPGLRSGPDIRPPVGIHRIFCIFIIFFHILSFYNHKLSVYYTGLMKYTITNKLKSTSFCQLERIWYIYFFPFFCFTNNHINSVLFISFHPYFGWH